MLFLSFLCYIIYNYQRATIFTPQVKESHSGFEKYCNNFRKVSI